MNLSISRISQSFGGISRFKKLAQGATNCIAQAKNYAKTKALKNAEPDNFQAKNLVEKTPKQILEKYNQFTAKNFKELSPDDYKILKARTETLFQNEFEAMCDMAELTEKWLDKMYGKDNWVFVSIGRSLEGLADALAYKGHDTKILPISGIHSLNLTADEIAHQEDFKIYEKFLKKNGISKSAIEKDRRHYVFADYCYSGATIQTVKKLLKYNLGIDSKNVDFKDFVALYKDAYSEASAKRKCTKPSKIENMLTLCDFKSFCRTARVECSDLASVTQSQTVEQPLNSKLFHFKLMDEYLPKRLDYMA